MVIYFTIWRKKIKRENSQLERMRIKQEANNLYSRKEKKNEDKIRKRR